MNSSEGGGTLKWSGPVSRGLLAMLFATSAVLHFTLPTQYANVIPPWLPAHGLLVLMSGIAELAGALGLLWRPLRRSAGLGLLLLCVAVFPANVQMWLDAIAAHKAFWIEAALLLRLPLQLPLMAWIWRVARG